MFYADLILPVPLYGLFTYLVPEALVGKAQRGTRVLVPFGQSKRYVGIVVRVHNEEPKGFRVKPIAEVMEDSPILLEPQMKLWQWMADYYMAPIGDVMKTALPSALKDVEGYRPRTETFIRLAPAYRNEAALHVALNLLGRAQRQLAAFIDYLALSKWDTVSGDTPTEPLHELTREELSNATGCSLAILSTLVKRGFLELYEVEASRLNRESAAPVDKIKKLSKPQETAFNDILFSFLSKDITLLHGVTSSGKTEIYIHLIERELKNHRQVLYLLPEIALTVQIMERLRRVFGHRLGIYHSRYSDTERAEIWQKQLSEHPYDVILGARSAVFLPFQRLGLILIDEEHETSYKQQDPAPRYHARSAAMMLARMTEPRPRVLLGTATPSAETYHLAKQGRYGLVKLTERYKGIEMPHIEVVDTGDLQRRKMMTGPFSPLLLARVREALESGQQAILFQNRRGWAPVVECKQCGWVPHCPDCDVSLTLHRNSNQLSCHYCGYTMPVPTECPACGGRDLFTIGYGTEKIEDKIREVFPEARVARMDLDTTRTSHAYERIIGDFAAGRTNLLIGTQMISKGLDFDKVGVVGILNADSMLNQPDFRAYEHAFMMMAQVSGRAGRKGKQGLVVLQTKNPTEPVIAQVVSNDYDALYADLMEERAMFHYPPFTRLTYIYLKHRDDQTVATAALTLGSQLRQWFGTRVLGPDKPSVARIKTLNIRKIVLKLEPGIDMPRVRQYLLMARNDLLKQKQYTALGIFFDVDPG